MKTEQADIADIRGMRQFPSLFERASCDMKSSALLSDSFVFFVSFVTRQLTL